jgi:hypothetical protein
VLYDEFHAITIASDGHGLALRERSLARAAVRFFAGFLLLGVGVLTVVVFLGPEGPRPAGQGLSIWLGRGAIGLFVTTLGILPIVVGVCFMGLRSEYSARQSEHRLWAVTRLLGLVLWSRAFSFAEFRRVGLRHVRRGPFGGAWWFVVSCEGASASVEIATCSEYQRAALVAEALAAQMGLPVRFEGAEGVAYPRQSEWG